MLYLRCFCFKILQSISQILQTISQILQPISQILQPISQILQPISQILQPISQILHQIKNDNTQRLGKKVICLLHSIDVYDLTCFSVTPL